MDSITRCSNCVVGDWALSVSSGAQDSSAQWAWMLSYHLFTLGGGPLPLAHHDYTQVLEQIGQVGESGFKRSIETSCLLLCDGPCLCHLFFDWGLRTIEWNSLCSFLCVMQFMGRQWSQTETLSCFDPESFHLVLFLIKNVIFFRRCTPFSRASSL